MTIDPFGVFGDYEVFRPFRAQDSARRPNAQPEISLQTRRFAILTIHLGPPSPS